MIKLKYLIIVHFVVLTTNLIAFEVKESSLYYLKGGAIIPPGDRCVLPAIGLGARYQRDKYGLDLSVSLGSLIFTNYASLKGLLLLYPFPECKNQFYLGAGSGIGYHLNAVPMGQPYGSASDECGDLTLEGILGYEFRHSCHFKTFVQLEISQPIVKFGKNRHSQCFTPGIAIALGMGF